MKRECSPVTIPSALRSHPEESRIRIEILVRWDRSQPLRRLLPSTGLLNSRVACILLLACLLLRPRGRKGIELRKGKPFSGTRGLIAAVPFALLVLGVSMVIHLAAEKAHAEDIDYIPVYIRDVPVPSPGGVGPDVYLASPIPTSPPPNGDHLLQ